MSITKENANLIVRNRWLAFKPWSWSWTVLHALYTEPHRRYHTFKHIAHCLRTVDKLETLFNRATVDMALIWHDAVYETAKDARNEYRSTRLMEAALPPSVYDPYTDRELPAHVFERNVGPCIAWTDHKPGSGLLVREIAVTVDVDLAILAEDPVIYDAYARDVRKEYAAVSDPAWRHGRSDFLMRMLDRKRIYVLDETHERWEKKARENMKRELEALTTGLLP